MDLSILNLLFVLLAAWLAGNIATRLGYPSIFGELTAGIILGPPLLGLLHTSEALEVLAQVGVLLMMLYIGMEIDPKDLFKASWAGTLAALGGFITPFALCYLLVVALGGTVAAGLFVGIAAGVTSLATKSRILVDLKLLDTRIAHVLMAGALISDTLALIVFAAIIGVFEANGFNVAGLGLVASKAILFFGLVTFIGLKGFPPLWRRLRRAGWNNRTFNATLILLIALLFAELAELAGLHAILGGFLAGLFLREGSVLEPRLSRQLNEVVHDVSIGFLAPIFFVTAGFHVSLDVFQTDLPLLIGVVVLATVGKIVGTALFYLPSRNGWREGVVVGAGMNGRGAVEIILAQIGLGMGIITAEIFSILVFMAIITTAAVPLFLKWGSEWLKGRGELARSEDDRRGTIIVGAGPTARALARALGDAQPVRLIDKNWHSCRQARKEGLNVLHGSALDVDVLAEACAAEARTFLALTANDEVNVLSAQLARETFSVPVARVLLTAGGNGERSLKSLMDMTGISSLPGAWSHLAEWDRRLAESEVDRVTIRIDEITELQSFGAADPTGSLTLPLVVGRDGVVLPFPTVDELNPGDEVVALNARK
jgi:Kef-type K+ transport system membrane component KefB